MSLERCNYPTSFTGSDRRVSFSLPLNSSKELLKMENISKNSKKMTNKKIDDNELKNRSTSGDSDAPKPSYSDLQEGSDESSSDDAKPSIHESDSVSSQDVSFKKKRKKKWKIKLPWNKKNKPTKEFFESPNISEKNSSETEDGDDSDNPSSALSSSENVSKSETDLKPTAKNGKKRLAASWYGSQFNTGEKKEDSVAGATSKEAIMNPSKFGFHYHSSSSDAEAEIFPPSKPYHKRIKEKNKYLLPDIEVSKSNPSLSEKDSIKELQVETKSSISESSYSVEEETAGSNYSSKQQSPKIKKYYSLPSIFFKRNKKKKQKILKNQRTNHDEIIREEQSSDDVDLSQQQASNSKNADIQRRIKTNSVYVETPLVRVGSEKPVLKSWSPKENIFEREYSNNVETVTSIFKRSSYKRVYGNRISSSVTYPPPKATDEKKSTNKTQENLAFETSASISPSPKTSSLKEFKKSSVKQSVIEIKSEIPEQSESVIKNKKHLKDSTLTSNSNKENSLRESKKKVIATKAEINNYTEEPKIKPLNEKTNVIDSTSKEIKKNQGLAKSSVRQKGKNQQSPKEDILMVSKKEEAFDRTLERDLKAAKKTVEDVNNQFGQSIFTRNYRTKKTSTTPTSLTGSPPNIIKATSLSQNKLENAASTKVSKPIIRRRSYEEMVNKIEAEMFDSDDESSDTDGDQIDLSFKKPHLDATVNFEIRKSTERLDDSDSDGYQHIYHIRVHKHEKPAPARENKKSPVVMRPTFGPPLSPLTTTYMVNEDKEKLQELITEKTKEPVDAALSLPIRNYSDDSSHGYSSSSEDENEVIYANAKVKFRKLKESKEINQLLDESIKKFVLPDSPPHFSPPPIIPEPKFSPGINDRLAYTNASHNLPIIRNENAIPSPKINQEDKVSANYIAKQLLLKREQQKQNFFGQPDLVQLPIKNIKSYQSSGSSLPPVPPSLPPPEDDPFWVPQKQVQNSSFVKNYINRLSIAHLPTISYSPTSEAEAYNKPSKSSSVSPTTLTKSTTKQLQPKYDSEFHEPQILSSPVLLKAELVDRGSKDKPVLEVKREFVGPYKVSPMRDGTQQDTRKQAVSFNIPHSKIDKNDNMQPVEQIYANESNTGDFQQSALVSQSNAPVREDGVSSSQEKNCPSINSQNKINAQENKTIIQNVSNQYNTYPQNRAEYYSQQKLANHQYISERNKLFSANEDNNKSFTQLSKGKTSPNNIIIPDKSTKKAPKEQIYANEPNPRLYQQFNSSQKTSMMKRDIPDKQDKSSAPIELNKRLNSPQKKSYSHNWRNQFNEFPYNKVDHASEQTQDGLHSFPERTEALPIVQNSNIGSTQTIGTPLNYKITRVSQSEKTFQNDFSTERFQSENVSSNTAPTQRPPLKSILRKSQKTASLTSEKGLSATEQSLPQETNSLSLQKSNGRERYDSATYFKEFDVERVKIDSASSDSGTPPAIPDYPPPPPRKMTEIQHIFIESLLQPNEALQNPNYNFTTSQNTSPHSPQQQRSKTALQKVIQNFGSPSSGQARSRAPYIDFSDSDFEPVQRVTYSSLPIQQPFQIKSYQSHQNAAGSDFASQWTDNGKFLNRMEMMDRKENSDYMWNNIQDQFIHEQIYENYRLKTDV